MSYLKKILGLSMVMICIFTLIGIQYTSFATQTNSSSLFSKKDYLPIHENFNFIKPSSEMYRNKGWGIFRLRRRGKPTRTIEMGGRGPCDEEVLEDTQTPDSEINTSEAVVAILPRNSKSSESPNDPFVDTIGITVLQYPKLWFYIPASANVELRNYEAELMILKEDNQNFLDVPIRLIMPNQSGIVGIEVTEKELEPNEKYHWFLSLLCDSRKNSRSSNLDGWIIRVDGANIDELPRNIEGERIPLDAAFTAPTVERRLDILLEFQIWNDLITILVEYVRNPMSLKYEDMKKKWNLLLTATNLDEIKNQQIIGCYQLSRNSQTPDLVSQEACSPFPEHSEN